MAHQRIMHQETITLVAELVPTIYTFRTVQLAHRASRLDAYRQFAARSRFRTLRRSLDPNGMWVWYNHVLPNGWWDGTVINVLEQIIVERTYYVSDRLHGQQVTWYPNGYICDRVCYVSDLRCGEYISWYESGHIMERYHYVDGVRRGVYKCWSESGNLDETRTY